MQLKNNMQNVLRSTDANFPTDVGEASLHEVCEFADDAPDAHVLPNGNGLGELAGHSSQGYLLPKPASRPRRRKADQERPVRLGVAAVDGLPFALPQRPRNLQLLRALRTVQIGILGHQPSPFGGRGATRPTAQIRRGDRLACMKKERIFPYALWKARPKALGNA